MPETNSKQEQLEIAVQASRVRFKPGADLVGHVVRHVDVKVDDHNDGGKDIFTMNLKITYDNATFE
jgi:hypothetical protein